MKWLYTTFWRAAGASLFQVDHYYAKKLALQSVHAGYAKKLAPVRQFSVDE